MESVVHEGAQVTKPTPPIRTHIYIRAAISGVAGAQGGKTETDRLTGAAQDAVSEEAATLVKYRTGLEIGRAHV